MSNYKSKHTGAQVDEAVSKVLNGEVGGSGGATPDWNAQPGESGYIENRTHYVTGTGVDLKYKTLDEVYIPDTIARKSDIPVPIIINYNTIKDAANSEVNTISEQTWLKYIANDTYKNYDWIIQRDGIKYNCTVIPDYDNEHIQILYFTRNEIEGTSGPLGNAIMKYSGLRIQLSPYTQNTYLIYKISNGGSLEMREFVFGETYNKNAYLIAAAQMSGIDTIDCKWVYTTKADGTITVNGQKFYIENSVTNVDAIFSVEDKSLTYVDGNGLINKVTFADNGSYNISKNKPFEEIFKNVTYSELKSLKVNSQLVPGQQYRITDYVTTTTQSNTQSAGHQFDIIVTADSTNILNEKARAIQHEDDTYFANSNLAAWELWYSLDNDEERFSWARNPITYFDTEYDIKRDMIMVDTDAGKYVYFRYPDEDTDINQCAWVTDPNCLDVTFKNAELIHTLSDIIYTYTDRPSVGEIVTAFGNSDCTIVDVSWIEGKGVIYRMIDEFGNDCPYDFKNIMFLRNYDDGDFVWYYTFTNFDYDSQEVYFSISDCSVHPIRGYEGTSYCRNNIIKCCTQTNYYIDEGSSYDKIYYDYSRYLNDIVMICESSIANYSNTFDFNCHNITLNSNCYLNTFGNDCCNIVISGGGSNNTFLHSSELTLNSSYSKFYFNSVSRF